MYITERGHDFESEGFEKFKKLFEKYLVPLNYKFIDNFSRFDGYSPDRVIALDAGGKTLLIYIEIKHDGRDSTINELISKFDSLRRKANDLHFLLIVPSASEKTTQALREHKISYGTLNGDFYLDISPYIYIYTKENITWPEYTIREFFIKIDPDKAKKVAEYILKAGNKEITIKDIVLRAELPRITVNDIITFLTKRGYLVRTEPSNQFRRGFIRLLNREGLIKELQEMK
ncbi:MAG: hypothetical protein A2252_01505 [Elusimicrobia bacterium RIFOXYA2_FULL_39_19]|nr:MAG: hypothetical protein A2252_01505 [Elusimicrobia bacterium RIFOXYA2_FULL_39_19]